MLDFGAEGRFVPVEDHSVLRDQRDPETGNTRYRVWHTLSGSDVLATMQYGFWYTSFESDYYNRPLRDPVSGETRPNSRLGAIKGISIFRYRRIAPDALEAARAERTCDSTSRPAARYDVRSRRSTNQGIGAGPGGTGAYGESDYSTLLRYARTGQPGETMAERRMGGDTGSWGKGDQRVPPTTRSEAHSGRARGRPRAERRATNPCRLAPAQTAARISGRRCACQNWYLSRRPIERLSGGCTIMPCWKPMVGAEPGGSAADGMVTNCCPPGSRNDTLRKP